MAMTSVVKDELSRVQVIKPCCRKAEVSTLLRFAGGLHLSEGRVVIEAELEDERGRRVYELELLGSDGRVYERYYDAVTGELLKEEPED